MKIRKSIFVPVLLISLVVFGLCMPFGKKYLSVDLSSEASTKNIYIVMNELPNHRASISVNIVGSLNGRVCISEILDFDGNSYEAKITKSRQAARINDVPLKGFSVILTPEPCEVVSEKTGDERTIQVEPKWRALSLYDRIRFAT